ncbi:MAG TPA: malto-oligosyltrehalose synthase [Candidatus Dormibacteraeota bacterium]
MTPSSTYRLQLHSGFDFDAAVAVAPYLAALGVSHAYTSPYLQAAKGSSHGYDVVDHSRVNVELGGEEGHQRFCQALGENRLGQVLDIVPNHMSIAGRDNRWWWDVLRQGRRSRYAGYFDVDWNSPEPKLRGKVLMPILGDHYGRVLDAGDIKLVQEPDGLVLHYFEHELPIDPESLAGGDLERDPERLAADPEALHELLERQNYRLASWRTAGQDLDYRRFFDVNSLAALRMEEGEVFQETHALVLGWLAAGVLDGLRVDHPDGLRDPRQYLERLRQAAPGAWIVVEKILAAEERLPADWPVDGTTGYEFGNRLTALYVDGAAETPLSRFYAQFAGIDEGFAEIAYRSKKLVLGKLLASDLRRLTANFVRVCEGNRLYRDFTRFAIGEVLAEFIACLPVYRTYARPGEPVSPADRAPIEAAAGEAKRRRPDLDPELVDFLVAILLGEHTGEEEANLVARLQQTTGAVMAKGVEDTAFYVYNRFVALNEVGGDPGRFAIGPETFHAATLETARTHPAGMLTSSTHDSKRSEDVRARLALLSEIPGEWTAAVLRWSALNARHRRAGLPDRNIEYHLYQTLVGAHPIGPDRLLPYAEKAAREAKTHTSWTAVDEDYERAVREFVERALADSEFLAAVDGFAGPLVGPGRVNSLAWKLLVLTAPGVPDLYQGSELWDLSLVDPDNRRPVDYDLRRRLLGELDGLAAEEAWARPGEGLPKLLVVQRTLQLRRRRPAAYGPEGTYRPLVAHGPKARHAVAFARAEEVVTVVPRLVLGLAGEWAGTELELPPGQWRDEFTCAVVDGGRQPLANLLGRFPVALLARV